MRTFVVALLLLTAAHASAQIVAIPKPQQPAFRNSIGFGASVGPFFGRDAYFWGIAVDYGRTLRGPWSIAASLAFDRDTETLNDGATKMSDTLTAVGIVNYSIGRFTFTTGLAKGFANTDNPERSMRFKNGDWGTGIVIGVSFPELTNFARDSIAVSVGYEYNLTQKEPDITFDIGYAIAF